MADPDCEAKVLETEVQPRIHRMRARLKGLFPHGNIPVQPHKMSMSAGGLPLTPPDKLDIIAHALQELDDVEKSAASEGMVRMKAFFDNKSAARTALYRVQCLEYLLFPFGIYTMGEIANTMGSQAKAA